MVDLHLFFDRRMTIAQDLDAGIGFMCTPARLSCVSAHGFCVHSGKGF